MLLFNQISKINRSSIAVIGLLLLSACQFQPLHSDRSAGQGGGFEKVGVSSVNNRVGQQVRNHLLFLLNGGFASSDKTHEVKLRVSFSDKQLAAIAEEQDSTAGTVSVRVSYDIIDLKTGESIATGTRNTVASYDRTGQVLANNRATRDAENRAAKEAAESLRLAIANHINQL